MRGEQLCPEIAGPRNERVTVREGVILFARILLDESCGNPLEEGDCLGRIYSFSWRVGDKHFPDAYKNEEGLKEWEAEHPFCQKLRYFEHGGCEWALADEGSPGTQCPWDSVGFAGYWVPESPHVLTEIQEASDPQEHARALARVACEEYTRWANGDCWGFQIEAFRTRRAEDGEVFDQLEDYRFLEPLAEDSCWGFIGAEYAQEQAEEAAAGVLAAAEKRVREA